MSRIKYSAIAASAMALALTASACGGGSGGSTAQAVQGVTDTTITLGYSGPLSGAVALAGQDETSGINAAINEVNASGGINGRQVKLVTRDDQYTPAKQALNLRQLAQEDKVFAIVGVPDAGVSSQWPLIKNLGIPLWGPIFPQDPGIRNVFIMGSTVTGQTDVLMSHICKSIGNGPLRIASIQAQLPFGQAAQDTIEKAAAQCPRLSVVSEQKVPPTETNLTPVVLNAKASNPDVVYMGATSTQDVQMMKIAGQQGFNPIFVGNGSTMAESGMETLPNLQGRAYRATTIRMSGPGADAYTAATRKIGVEPNTQGEEEYAITKALLEALRTAGHDLTWDKFIAAAEKLRYDTQVMSPTMFGPLPDGHRASTGVILQQVANNKWNDMGDFVEPPLADNKGL